MKLTDLFETQEPIFYTEKGSRYLVHSNGTTTRFKAPRPEHPGEHERGQQPRSDKTVYVNLSDVNEKLSLFQAEGDGVKLLLPVPGYPGKCGIWYATGPYKGKWAKSSITDYKTSPEIGLIPIEIFSNGHKVHFGNKIVKLN